MQKCLMQAMIFIGVVGQAVALAPLAVAAPFSLTADAATAQAAQETAPAAVYRSPPGQAARAARATVVASTTQRLPTRAPARRVQAPGSYSYQSSCSFNTRSTQAWNCVARLINQGARLGPAMTRCPSQPVSYSDTLAQAACQRVMTQWTAAAAARAHAAPVVGGADDNVDRCVRVLEASTQRQMRLQQSLPGNNLCEQIANPDAGFTVSDCKREMGGTDLQKSQFAVDSGMLRRQLRKQCESMTVSPEVWQCVEQRLDGDGELLSVMTECSREGMRARVQRRLLSKPNGTLRTLKPSTVR